MFHLAAFAEDLDPAGALVNVAATPDQSVVTTGDDLRVPTQLPFMIGEAGVVSATLPIQAQFQSPSLRQVANIDVEPVALGLVFADPAELSMHPLSPTPLNGDESLNFLVNTNPAAAEVHYGLTFLADGVQQPVQGEIYSVRATMAVTADEIAWVNGNLTFAQDLPVGRYQVVGMRARAAGLVAARLNFIGGAYRPGCPGAVSIEDKINPLFRHGGLGVWGTFHTNTPPTVDILAATAAITPVIILDLIFIGG